MNRTHLIFFIFVLLAISGCKRFDSNKLNRTLIEGKWEQIEVRYPNEKQDSLIIENTSKITYLTFYTDSCVEEMLDINENKHYNFQIEDYTLELAEEGQKPNHLKIIKLTKDSLILRTKHQLWKYIKNAD